MSAQQTYKLTKAAIYGNFNDKGLHIKSFINIPYIQHSDNGQNDDKENKSCQLSSSTNNS